MVPKIVAENIFTYPTKSEKIILTQLKQGGVVPPKAATIMRRSQRYHKKLENLRLKQARVNGARQSQSTLLSQEILNDPKLQMVARVSLQAVDASAVSRGGSRVAQEHLEDDEGNQGPELPMEMMLRVFGHLSNAELLRAARVSGWWRAVASSRSAWWERRLTTRGPACSRVGRRALVTALRRLPRADTVEVVEDVWKCMSVEDIADLRCAANELSLAVPADDGGATAKAIAMLRRQVTLAAPTQILRLKVPDVSADPRKLLHALNACKPKHLVFTSGRALSRAKYAMGANASRAPTLVSLYYIACSDRGDPDVALKYLLNCHAPSLEEVDVSGVSPSFRLGALLAERSKCLRRLRCEAAEDLPSLLPCPDLEIVRVRGFASNPGPVVEFIRGATGVQLLQLDGATSRFWRAPGHNEKAWEAALDAVEAVASSGESRLNRLAVTLVRPPDSVPLADFWRRFTTAAARLKHMLALDLTIDQEEWRYAPLPDALFGGDLDDHGLRLSVLRLPGPVHGCTPDARAYLKGLCRRVAANPRLHIVGLVRKCACPTPPGVCENSDLFEGPCVGLGDTFNLFGHASTSRCGHDVRQFPGKWVWVGTRGRP